MATHPGMIEYFPITPKEGLTETMLPGGTILLFNTEDVKEHIMKWAADTTREVWQLSQI